ncbi:hypothetical protein BU23DRAFT_597550 [Bimuria novae-zelandiae CBS 107.79]|uniref:C2H2-type domain-containing protein n=1 Tax=Bimuria novae-zelandiae CBS 107.79 TaxID=1447943 RepID=A0A6A5VRE1_9PLEO|nr:hypothetical protein BU23DRAFT_597550 [Bimuria novae-zelandiae CBS 107.79]
MHPPHRRNMRRRLPIHDSSDESEYTESNADGSVTSDTDLTDDETCSNEDGKQGEETNGTRRTDLRSHITVSVGTLYTFFNWLLNQRQGKGGVTKASQKARLKEDRLRQGLYPWIKTLGEITGFAQVTRPYSLRYTGGKAFNENGNISEAMQNLIMGHANIRTFLKHYLSRRVTVDTQAVVRGIQPQDALMRAACTMSRSIDARRPRSLTPDQSASVNDDPIVRSLLAQQERLKRSLANATRHSHYQALNRKINQTRQRLRHALLQEIKERWEYEQPVRDVEQQLAGIEAKDVAAAAMSCDAMLSAQKALVDTVLTQPGTSLQEEVSQRNRAIRAVMDYCGIEEGGIHLSRLKQSKGHVVPLVTREEELQCKVDKELEAAKVSVYKEKRPRICFVCLGNEKLPTAERTHSFHTLGDLSKHFMRRHLANVRDGDLLRCGLCQIDIEHKMHWQRHAHEVHGTVSLRAA